MFGRFAWPGPHKYMSCSTNICNLISIFICVYAYVKHSPRYLAIRFGRNVLYSSVVTSSTPEPRKNSDCVASKQIHDTMFLTATYFVGFSWWSKEGGSRKARKPYGVSVAQAPSGEVAAQLILQAAFDRIGFRALYMVLGRLF